MKAFALVLAALAIAGSAHAEDQAPTAVQPASSSANVAAGQTSTAQDVQKSGYCSKDNPFEEYRDCVNASTRDPNAKVRMA